MTDECDLLIMPTVNVESYNLNSINNTENFLEASLSNIGNTAVFDMTGQPSLSINVGGR